MVVGVCHIELDLPGVHSLKQKRSVLKSIKANAHKKFNVSCAEVGLHDAWGSSTLGVAVVSTTPAHCEQVLEAVVRWIEFHRPDVQVVDHYVEILR